MTRDHRIESEEKKLLKIQLLLDEIAPEAIEKNRRLSLDGVPINDPRRELKVSPDALKLASELGFDRIYGLRLYA